LKKILLTGSEGFIGKSLKEAFKHRSDFVFCCPTLAELNLTNSTEVAQCIAAFQPDIIIHSATSNTIGKGYETDVCEQNLRMFFNLLRYRPDGAVLYTLCSGSSYNRDNWVDNMDENYLGVHIPTDAQGFSKYVIASHARHLDDVVTLRLFGIFGKHEDYRYKFISNTIAKRLAGLDVTLFRDAIYDYLDVDDFGSILQQFIDQNIRSGEFNITPNNSVRLSKIIETVDQCLGIQSGYTIATAGFGKPYTGSNSTLTSALKGLKFTPIAESISRLIQHYIANPHLIDQEALEQDQLLQHAKSINSK
jgi:UDP-glucose 4-epimerase